MSREATYTPLHSVVGGEDSPYTPAEDSYALPQHSQHSQHSRHSNQEDYDYNDDDDNDDIVAHRHKHNHMKKEVLESFDFNDVESMMWRKVK